MVQLNGSTIQKGDSFTLDIDLEFNFDATLTSGSKVLSGIKEELFDLLEQGLDWLISGVGIAANSAITETCRDKQELTLSFPVTADGLKDLTVTTGSLTNKTIELTVYKSNTFDAPVIEKSSTNQDEITVDSGTKARIFLLPADTSTLVIPKPKTASEQPKLELTYFVKAISTDGDIDTINAGTFSVVPLKKTPNIPQC